MINNTKRNKQLKLVSNSKFRKVWDSWNVSLPKKPAKLPKIPYKMALL